MDDGRSYWDRQASSYGRSMWFLGGPLPRMVALAAEGARGAERGLEVAAGTGLVSSALAEVTTELVATDYAEAMLAQLSARMKAEGRTNVRVEQADVYALRYEAASFDVVVAANVLHLLPDLDAALAALRRVMKPGARLIAPTYLHAETARARLASRVMRIAGFPGQRRFTARSLREALERSGLWVTRQETIPGGVLPIGYIEGSFEDRVAR